MLPAFRRKVDAWGWRDLIELAPQLMSAPRSLGQHVGGMILSESPISGMVPIREGAIEGRYIMDWNKDSVADANFAKIDLLSLPVLDQLEEALDLIEQREGGRPDLSRIDPEDPGVYDMINQGRSKGVFLLQPPAQLKMGQRLKSRSLLDLAYRHDIGSHDDPPAYGSSDIGTHDDSTAYGSSGIGTHGGVGAFRRGQCRRRVPIVGHFGDSRRNNRCSPSRGLDDTQA